MADGLALIIEDSHTQSQIIGKMVQSEDWTYATAKTLEEALSVLVRQRPSLVFVDIFLGEENTLGHLQAIRDLAPEATIAVMTAGSREEAIDETLRAARRANVDYVLRKPFTPKQLRAIVQAAYDNTSEGRKRNHALVVDDSPVVSHLTAQILTDNGYRVSTAKSMEEALANPDIAHLDLLVSDIFMPGMGGLEGIKIIKGTWPKVRVLAMSAGLGERVTSERATSAAVRAGADAEIRKPFQPHELMHTVIDLMA
ncbi:hypothetical protein AEAC466_13265 [Asticcacaulis sp. AC466]|uniref:response regulator n=1 Tax=Asticcacaulis sp. AC466 TaxID=1282362 RepID=UPI0003C3C387|nr:response regulator [Asticcacaulis sp. AC466]ESQ83215.1 hypothetical protein AEAC466_13265 [Asticcacaulis sp. AC466]